MILLVMDVLALLSSVMPVQLDLLNLVLDVLKDALMDNILMPLLDHVNSVVLDAESVPVHLNVLNVLILFIHPSMVIVEKHVLQDQGE